MGGVRDIHIHRETVEIELLIPVFQVQRMVWAGKTTEHEKTHKKSLTFSQNRFIVRKRYHKKLISIGEKFENHLILCPPGKEWVVFVF